MQHEDQTGDELGWLPSPPHTLARVIEAASDPDVSAPALGRLVGSDPSFAAELLRMANSSLYRRGSPVSTIERAVSVLGSRTLRNVALCVGVRSCVSTRELRGFDLNHFWEGSLRRAVAAQLIAARLGGAPDVEPAEAFTFGLLQDLGVLALVRQRPELCAAWMEVAALPFDARRERERELFGRSHDAVGQALIDRWTLPDDLGMPLRYHHEVHQAPQAPRSRCQVAYLAEHLVDVFSVADKRLALTRARDVLAREVGWTSAEVDQLLDMLGRKVQEVAGELGFRVGQQPSLESILQAANTGLLALNLSYEELVQKLEQTLAEKEDLARQLEVRNKQLEELLLTDDLTSLHNRRALSLRMTYEIKRTARGGHLVFLTGDLDHFKRVNDTWGHDFGDLVLKSAASAMQSALRDTDMVARVGGEEFGILLPATDIDNAMVAAERVRKAVAQMYLTSPDGKPFTCTVSLGMAGITGPCRVRVTAERVAKCLWKAADVALYDAKASGRNCIVSAPTLVQWEDTLESAA